MDLTLKNKRPIIGFTILLLAAMGLFFMWLQKRALHDDADLLTTVSPTTLYTGDSLHFNDRTPFAQTHKWDFGDGNTTGSDSGSYCYAKPGYYQLKLTVNNRYTRSFDILVNAPLVTYKAEDSLVTIEAPDEALQFEHVVFRCNALHGRYYKWKFGETGNVDSRNPVEIYMYKKPGDYTVLLWVNTTQYYVSHHIKILPAFKSSNDSCSVDEKYRYIDDDFKVHLQAIADGSNVNDHYEYLLKKYLCKNEKAFVKINGTKTNNFYDYCMQLQFDKGTVIQSVKCGFDDKQDCVTKTEVQQTK